MESEKTNLFIVQRKMKDTFNMLFDLFLCGLIGSCHSQGDVTRSIALRYFESSQKDYRN